MNTTIPTDLLRIIGGYRYPRLTYLIKINDCMYCKDECCGCEAMIPEIIAKYDTWNDDKLYEKIWERKDIDFAPTYYHLYLCRDVRVDQLRFRTQILVNDVWIDVVDNDLNQYIYNDYRNRVSEFFKIWNNNTTYRIVKNKHNAIEQLIDMMY